MGIYLSTSIKHILGDHAHVGDIRGDGMIFAIELVRDKDSRTFFDAADSIGLQVASLLLS